MKKITTLMITMMASNVFALSPGTQMQSFENMSPRGLLNIFLEEEEQLRLQSPTPANTPRRHPSIDTILAETDERISRRLDEEERMSPEILRLKLEELQNLNALPNYNERVFKSIFPNRIKIHLNEAWIEGMMHSGLIDKTEEGSIYWLERNMDPTSIKVAMRIAANSHYERSYFTQDDVYKIETFFKSNFTIEPGKPDVYYNYEKEINIPEGWVEALLKVNLIYKNENTNKIYWTNTRIEGEDIRFFMGSIKDISGEDLFTPKDIRTVLNFRLNNYKEMERRVPDYMMSSGNYSWTYSWTPVKDYNKYARTNVIYQGHFKNSEDDIEYYEFKTLLDSSSRRRLYNFDLSSKSYQYEKIIKLFLNRLADIDVQNFVDRPEGVKFLDPTFLLEDYNIVVVDNLETLAKVDSINEIIYLHNNAFEFFEVLSHNLLHEFLRVFFYGNRDVYSIDDVELTRVELGILKEMGIKFSKLGKGYNEFYDLGILESNRNLDMTRIIEEYNIYSKFNSPDTAEKYRVAYVDKAIEAYIEAARRA